ncbi:MAG TPA: tetratricopeptide repeat protein [Bryobacteraceae bacterium]|nr:tetratricopeptide repeat protein [Bryobacteraceae bacterium]
MIKTISAVCLLAIPLFCQTDESAAARFRDVKNARLTSNQRIAAYEKLLQKSPADPKIQAGLAEAFIQKLRETTDFAYLNRASALVDKMLAADPKSYDAIRLRIEIETHRHNFPKAAELAQELVERNPSDTGMLGMLGDSLMEEGEYAAAGKAYRRMVELSPNLTSYNRVAYHDFVTGNSGQALAWMNLAVQAGSPIPENLAWCLVEFGDMLFKAGYSEEARAMYNRSLETLPGYHRAYAALGRFYAATGEYQRAAGNFQKAQEVIPLPEYAAALEALDGKLGNSAGAARQRDLLDVIDKLGAANGEKGNRALALDFADENRHLDRALQLAQGELATRKDVYTYDALSWVLFRAGRQSEAEDASAKAMAQNTPEPMFYYHAGMIAMAGGRIPEGRQMLRRALSLNPNFAFPQADDARRLAGNSASATIPQIVIH